MRTLALGDLVKRGPDWRWDYQDKNNGETVVGEVVKLKDTWAGEVKTAVVVRWGGGYTDGYRDYVGARDLVKINNLKLEDMM